MNLYEQMAQHFGCDPNTVSLEANLAALKEVAPDYYERVMAIRNKSKAATTRLDTLHHELVKATKP
jgi:hypothetical protein